MGAYLFGLFGVFSVGRAHEEVPVNAAELVKRLRGLLRSCCFGGLVCDELPAHPHARGLGFGRRRSFDGFELRDGRAARVARGEVALRQHGGVDGHRRRDPKRPARRRGLKGPHPVQSAC